MTTDETAGLGSAEAGEVEDTPVDESIPEGVYSHDGSDGPIAPQFQDAPVGSVFPKLHKPFVGTARVDRMEPEPAYQLSLEMPSGERPDESVLKSDEALRALKDKLANRPEPTRPFRKYEPYPRIEVTDLEIDAMAEKADAEEQERLDSMIKPATGGSRPKRDNPKPGDRHLPAWKRGLPDWQRELPRTPGWVPSELTLHNEQRDYEVQMELSLNQKATLAAREAGRKAAENMGGEAPAGSGSTNPFAESKLKVNSMIDEITAAARDKFGPDVEIMFLSKEDMKRFGFPEVGPNEGVNLHEKDFESDSVKVGHPKPDHWLNTESGFVVHKSAEGPVVSDFGTPLIGFTYSALMPNGDLVDGAVQIPASHDGYTRHGQLKNLQLLAQVVADTMIQFTVEMSQRMNLIRAEEAASEGNCDR